MRNAMRKCFKGGFMRRKYYLHKRKGIYYAELIVDGHKLGARSTKKTTEDEALLVVSRWLEDGIPGKGGKARPVEVVMNLSGILKAIRKTDLDGEAAMKIVNTLKEKQLIDITISKAGIGAKIFTEFLDEFWDYDTSPYIREKRAHGQTIGKRHCYEMTSRVKDYYKNYFAGRLLNSIARADLKEFALFLSEKRQKPEGFKGNFKEKLSGSYVNKIMVAGLVALKFAFREGLIPLDVTSGLMRFSGTTKKRGVLTPLEAQAVFKVEWEDKRAHVGNLLALTTGLRAGEVLALRKSDIGDRVLYIRHSWSTMDGLKTPKNGEERKVPLLPQVREKLLELLAENPHKVDDPFIFYGRLENKPMDEKILINGLRAACEAIVIDARARNVVFHSWRHFYAARMADKMTADQIVRITGHKTKAVFEEYADHVIDENLEKMGRAAAESFDNILQFRKEA